MECPYFEPAVVLTQCPNASVLFEVEKDAVSRLVVEPKEMPPDNITLNLAEKSPNSPMR